MRLTKYLLPFLLVLTFSLLAGCTGTDEERKRPQQTKQMKNNNDWLAIRCRSIESSYIFTESNDCPSNGL